MLDALLLLLLLVVNGRRYVFGRVIDPDHYDVSLSRLARACLRLCSSLCMLVSQSK